MSEYKKSAERYAIVGANAILATAKLKKVIEQTKDTSKSLAAKLTQWVELTNN